METTKFMRIGEVARLVGIHPNTIRNLERRGLLHPARDWAGERRFTEADIQRLHELVGTAATRRTAVGGGSGARRTDP